MPAYNDIFFRRGASTSWSTTNPILRAAEVGYDTTEKKFKIGDGTTTWNNLEWASVIGVSGEQIFPESLHNLSGIYFDTTIDDVDQVAGQLNWNVDAGTLDIGLSDSLNTHIGQDVFYRVQNATGSTIYKGQSVYAAGVTAGGQRMQIAKYVADGSIDEVRFLGLATEDIANGEIGFVTHFGFVKNVDTRTTNTLINPGAETWNEGDILFAHPSTAGGLTKTKPQDDIYVSIVLGTGSAGELFVRPTNPGHINDLHDVDTTNLVDNNFLVWKDSAGYFEPSSGLYYVDDKLGVGTSSPNAIVHAYGDTPSGTVLNVEGTNGSLFSVVDNLSGTLMSVNTIAGLPVLEVNSDYSVIAGRFNQNDLVVASNGNVGVGIGSPTYKLHVDGTFRVDDDGSFFGDVTAASFIKSGGTSSQFLKADGSVDSSTYLTSHPAISAASSSNNSNRTYIQDVLLDSFGHVTGIATATETVTNTNTYVTSASFNTTNGIVTLTRNDAGTVTVDLDGRYLTSQTSHADVLVDGDFTTAGLMKTNGAGTYSIVTDNSSNWNTAYGWGDHSTEGYLTANQTITLTGDVSGTGTTSISVVVANDSHTHDTRYYTETEVDNLLSAKLSTSLKGAANGLAELDGTGKVPSAQLPSYVDDVLEYASTASFPATGESGKIYIAQDTNKTYRWGGSAYAEISASLALGTTSTTAFRGDYGNTAYTHSQATTGSVHGSTTVGGNFLRLSNPSAVTFIRVNADNTVSTLDATSFRTAIGAGTSSSTGTVTSVAAGNGLDFSTITTTGSVTLGTPSNVTLGSTNSVSATSHTHAFAPGGSTSQYIRGDGSLATFPSVLTTSTSFGGDVTGTYNAIVIADDSHNHVISNIDNLQTTLDGKVDNGTGPASNGYLAIWEDSTTITYDANVYYDSTNDYFGVNTNSPNASLHVYSSTPSGTVFNVEGTNGSLFSVVDNLSGTLMSVNNNAGLPVFEVFDDDTIVGGRYAQNDFVVTTSGDVGIGTANPAYKFHVNGTGLLSDVAVTGYSFINVPSVTSDTVVVKNESIGWLGSRSIDSRVWGSTLVDGAGSASTISYWTDANTISYLNTSTYPSLTEVSYVKGVTSAIQTQINSKTSCTGTVTSVSAGNGLDFTSISTTGSVTLGTPGSTTLSSTNAVTTTSHTHAFAPGGTTAQYIRGDGTLATLPTYTVNNGTLTMAVGGTGLSGSATFTANQSGNSTFTVTSNATSANTVSTIVARDASGNFSAGTVNTTQLNANNLRLDGNTLSSTNTNGNIVITPNGTGGIAAGSSATVSGSYAVVGGGRFNCASGFSSTVSGGYFNCATGNSSAISGGQRNLGSGSMSVANGGFCNVASGHCSVVSGGSRNKSLAVYSAVGGGYSNEACGCSSTISGGRSNTASGTYSTVGGGYVNTASGSCSTVGGGVLNTASGNSSTVSGGRNNTASGSNSSVSGGCRNVTNARHSSINGGHYNIIQSPTNECCSRGATIGGGVGHNTSGGTLDATTGDLTGTITCCDAGVFSTISGGLRNCATGACSTVGGGSSNTASGTNSTASGGQNNTASGVASTVSGGRCNQALPMFSTVSGGYKNDSSGLSSTIGGGCNNISCGNSSTVGGGYCNRALPIFSTVGGGSSNIASGSCSTISGGKSNTASATASTVSGGISNTASASYSTIGGGYFNCASVACSTVGGGLSNTASGYGSTVSGGCTNCASGGRSTIGGGDANRAAGDYSTVSGGRCNCASGTNSSVSGGCCNITNARHSTINGGHRNIIQSPTNECSSRGATIGGGVGHNSSGGTINGTTGDLTGTITCCNAGRFSTISGGLRNIATGIGSTVSGGFNNCATDGVSIVGGGACNTASGYGSTVSGGCGNTASAYYSTISGGAFNTASEYSSTVSGGYCNAASGTNSSVSGGCCNVTNARHSTINGGHRNIIQSPTNECSSRGATIGGGVGHNSSGGTLNATTGDLTGTITCCNAGLFSTIGGGLRNCATGSYSTVSSGFNNNASGIASTIGGGLANCASGGYSTIGGGYCNCASGNYSTVSGGSFGKASKYGELSHAAGRFAAIGDAQHSTLVARRNTTDATANQVLFLDGSSARLTIPAETTWMFSIKLAAHNDTNNDGAWWTFRGGIRRDAANGTAIIGSVIEENSKDTNMSTASASVVADDTNEALEIRVTGVAAKNIRWVAVVDISQVSWGTP